MIEPGLTHTLHYTVGEDRTVPHVLPESPEFAGVPRVLATAYTVALIEWAAMEAIRLALEPGQISVGTHVDVSHSAPTLPGMSVDVVATVTQVDGITVWFDVVASDEAGEISRGRHSRAVLDADRFVAGANRRGGQWATAPLAVPGVPEGS